MISCCDPGTSASVTYSKQAKNQKRISFSNWTAISSSLTNIIHTNESLYNPAYFGARTFASPRTHLERQAAYNTNNLYFYCDWLRVSFFYSLHLHSRIVQTSLSLALSVKHSWFGESLNPNCFGLRQVAQIELQCTQWENALIISFSNSFSLDIFQNARFWLCRCCVYCNFSKLTYLWSLGQNSCSRILRL